MKHYYLLVIAVILFIFNIGSTEALDCPGASFTSRQDIIKFTTSCTRIVGNVYISGSDINTVLTTGFQSVTSITGSLSFVNNPVLTSLTGFESLSSIGGDLLFSTNAALNSFAALQNLLTIGGHLNITQNPALTTLTSGFSSLTSISGSLIISTNNNLQSLPPFSSLKTVGKDVYVFLNPLLTSLDGLNQLTTIKQNLTIIGNNVLQGAEGFCSLSSIGNNLNIQSNPQMKSLDGLSLLRSVNGTLTVDSNNQLATVDGFLSLRPASVKGLILIQNNPALCYTSSINWTSIAAASYIVWKNAASCSSRSVPSTVATPSFPSTTSRSVIVQFAPANNNGGAITQYRIIVNGGLRVTLLNANYTGAPNTSTFCGNSIVSYNLTGLLPYTTYSINLEASNLFGSKVGIANSVRTSEAPPQNISIPAIVPATSRQIDVRFYAPGILNGVITAYRITRNGLEVFNGLPPSSGSPPLYVYNDRNLLPYTTYQYVVYSVNGGGATASPTLSGTTLEEFPIGMDPPTITGVSSTSIKVSWVAPLSPNGALKYYIVTLFVGASTSGTVVYNGTSTSTVVNGLSLKITYGATVTFYNSVGSVTSIAGTGQTTTNNNGFTVQPSILIVCIAALLSSVFVALYDH